MARKTKAKQTPSAETLTRMCRRLRAGSLLGLADEEHGIIVISPTGARPYTLWPRKIDDCRIGLRWQGWPPELMESFADTFVFLLQVTRDKMLSQPQIGLTEHDKERLQSAADRMLALINDESSAKRGGRVTRRKNEALWAQYQDRVNRYVADDGAIYMQACRWTAEDFGVHEDTVKKNTTDPTKSLTENS